MGVLARRLRTVDRIMSPPTNTFENLSAHMSAAPPSNIYPNPSEVIFKGQVLRIPPMSTHKIGKCRGKGWSPILLGGES